MIQTLLQIVSHTPHALIPTVLWRTALTWLKGIDCR